MNTKGDTGEESSGDLKQGGTLTADKNLWVLGNYSRFIRPGYRRIELESSPSGETEGGNLLLGSAWMSPDESEVVAVFVNLSHARRKVDLSMVSGEAGEVRTYVTDRGRNLRLDTSLQDLRDMELPARSVVTVVIGLEDAAGIGTIKSEGLRMKSEESDDAIYDLSGRKILNGQWSILNGQSSMLNGQLQKGIYIKDGRKIAK